MRFIAAVALAVALAAPAAANMPPPPEVYAEREAREAVLAWFENFNAGSVEGLAGMYSDRAGVEFVENGRVAYRDKAAIKASLEEAFKAMPGARSEIQGEPSVLAIDETAAVANAAFTVFLPDGKGGELRAFSGVVTLVLAKEGADGGSWRIVGGHSSGQPDPDGPGRSP